MKIQDIIVDRSPEQKRIRMEKFRAELAQMGFSIVETQWLKDTLMANLSRNGRKGPPRKFVQAAE